MKQVIYIVSILIFALSSCEKEDHPQKIQCGVSNITSYITAQDLLNCKYITGTYWVYIDSVSLQHDSVYIDSYNQGFMVDNVCNNKYEHHSFKTISYPSNSTYNYAVVSVGLFKNVNGVNSGTKIYDDYSTANSYFNFGVHRYDSMFVYNQYYYNVLQVTVDNDNSEQNKKSVYYINSDYGFLRHEIYQGSILSSNKILMKKNIER